MIKIMVIDDSLLIRQQFKKLFQDIKHIELIATATDPIDAFEQFKKVGLPDLFILDIEMPRMDGLSFLHKIYHQKPIPVIICSSLATKNSFYAVDALRMGASGIITKPTFNQEFFLMSYKDELIEMIDSAIISKVSVQKEIITQTTLLKKTAYDHISKDIVVIGASTGGVQAIEQIVTDLEANHPGIVIVQHMPEGFTAAFAKRLDSICVNSNIKEIEDLETIRRGHVYIAKGGIHLELVNFNGGFSGKLKNFSKVNSHKPSVDVLFNSLAKLKFKQCIAIVLTGMGSDGANGLLKLRNAGAKTYVQDKESSVIYGMPQAALKIDTASKTATLSEIANIINDSIEDTS